MLQRTEFRIREDLFPAAKERYMLLFYKGISYPIIGMSLLFFVVAIRVEDFSIFIYTLLIAIASGLLISILRNIFINKSIRTYRIIINEKGIENVESNAAFKFIEWHNMDYIEKHEGIWVIDITVLSIIRWFTGQG
ncbi:hypothetical protein QNI19_08290 [Cytophagaceae bacterium DM2B3-1]|uniref:Uncharacterized protein n=1 Tax=Xanthocytophaga flava TaxID=3048013 RepID=A0ABT7CGZ3_9BACT|nr:hypothetical protein [Xanthocytophaga flavus]MDJ1492927.1 hypothetical protein [Xanthocytophaga flavus]